MMNARKIWRNETDWYSAESRDEAIRIMMENHGYSPEDLDDEDGGHALEAEPLPDDKVISVTLRDGYEGGQKYPPWVDNEPEATLEWIESGRYTIARVKAPARIWAKHETGMVCTTEY